MMSQQKKKESWQFDEKVTVPINDPTKIGT